MAFEATAADRRPVRPRGARPGLAPPAVVIAAVLVCLPGVLAAQVNIEKMRQGAEALGFSASLEANLSSQSGNVDLTALGLEARTEYRWPSDTVFLVFRGDYGWQGGRQFSNEGLAHARAIHWLSGRVAVEGFVQSDYNTARLLDARGLTGAGMRLRLIRGKVVRVTMGTSYMFEHEALDLPPGATHPDRTSVSRWNNYGGASWTPNDRTNLSATAYVQPQFDAFDDVRVLLDGSLDTRVVGAMSLAVTFRLRYDSKPPDGIEPTDTKLTTGLAVHL